MMENRDAADIAFCFWNEVRESLMDLAADVFVIGHAQIQFSKFIPIPLFFLLEPEAVVPETEVLAICLERIVHGIFRKV